MVDRLTPEARSKNMAKTPGKDTDSELLVLSAAYALGARSASVLMDCLKRPLSCCSAGGSRSDPWMRMAPPRMPVDLYAQADGLLPGRRTACSSDRMVMPISGPGLKRCASDVLVKTAEVDGQLEDEQVETSHAEGEYLLRGLLMENVNRD